MEIRMATERDISGMLALLRQVGQVHHEIRPDIFRDGALKYTEQELQQILSDDNKPIFVADEQGNVAGYCFCQLRFHDGSGASTCRKELYIDDLCVEEACRGQKVGTALYEHALAFAKEMGCQFLTLNVWCGNEGAMKFYEHAGLLPRHVMMEKKLC